MGFGLHFLGIVHIPLLNREVRFDTGKMAGSFSGAYLLGLAFALVGRLVLALSPEQF